MICLRLFWEFFKTGLFAVGGGMATLPFLYDLSDRTGWFTHAQLADMVAVSESTPGPIGVNMATYVGFLTGGAGGAAAATLGLVAPSIAVVLIVSAFLQKFRDNRYVSGAFHALRQRPPEAQQRHGRPRAAPLRQRLVQSHGGENDPAHDIAGQNAGGCEHRLVDQNLPDGAE